MASFLSRYQDGEYREVWAELLALGAQVREEPLYSDALAVARETMRRVRYNIELLIPRLTELGYQFFTQTTMAMTGVMKSEPPVFSPPAANVDDVIATRAGHRAAAPFASRVLSGSWWSESGGFEPALAGC